MWFGVLGGLVVRGRDGESVVVPEVKVRTLLAVLLAHEGRGVSVDGLVEELWGARPPGNPANSLQAKVSQLRRAVGRERVVRQGPGYRLVLDGTEVDAVVFRELVEQARAVPDARERVRLLGQALELWRGPAFADFADAAFVRGPVRLLEELRLVAVEERAEARLALGHHDVVAGELGPLVEAEPLRERLRGLHLRALYRAGRQSEALTSYERLRKVLADELGVDPSPELSALHTAILRQDERVLSAGEDAGRTSDRTNGPTSGGTNPEFTTHGRTNPGFTNPGRTNPGFTNPGRTNPEPPGPALRDLPAPTTPLVGRAAALRLIGRLLAEHRLVTLTGPGGVGKTRLAVAAAGEVAAPDGVHLVEFAGLGGPGRPGGGDAHDLAGAVAAALGLRDEPARGAGPTERLADALRGRDALLVLDNCEHVIDAAADLTYALLRAAPRLRILATSQEPLGLAAAGEQVHAVEPLEPADAAALFTARAIASAPGFDPALDPDAIAEICRRLDGVPLALELAATRVRALGVRELAARIDDRFRLLGAGPRGLPARQQTLRAMIDWSWELLSPPERTVLARLAVHRDGCTLAAAEAVCARDAGDATDATDVGDAGDAVDRADVLGLLTRLVDRSLVTVTPGPPHHPAGPRYRLLESVSAYALERLAESGEQDAVRDLHLRHHLDLAERAAPRLRDGGQQAWLERLDAESGNLRAALDTATRREPDAAVRLGSALAWWWLLRGRLTEAYRALSGIPREAWNGELAVLHAAFGLLTGVPGEPLPSYAASAPPSAPAQWLYAYGLFSSGDPDGCGRHLDAHPPHPDDPWSTAAALALRALHALVRGDLDALERDGLRSAALFRQLGDRWGELQTVQPLTALADIKGAYADAERLGTEGLRIARDLGLAAEVSARLSGLGRTALLNHSWERARDLHEQARRRAIEQGYKYGEIHAEMGLALGARRSGDLDAAERHLVRLRDGLGALSSPAGDHLVAAEFGFAAELRGDAEAARAHHLRGLDAARVLAEPRAFALSLEGLAGAVSLAGAAGDAALLLGAADAARASSGAPLPPAERGDVDRITARASAALGASGFAGFFEAGTGLSPEEALGQAGLV
ncbi:BTAD domain-containing putative transcriptional regulator [Streptomyces sp. NPDC050095]|uniref:AfsR/SARP family transcriptional regulator n=1 Tax=unclassified Streptomyces TaxID=2593676 RepID=UPI0034427662